MTTPTYQDLTTNLTLRWVDVEDVRATQRAIIEVTPAGALLELPRGKRGEKGAKGDPGPGLWFRHLVTSRTELPNDLQAVDAGAAFPDTTTKSLWVWDGQDYLEVPDFIGLRGEPGAVPEVRVGTVEPGTVAQVEINQAASTDELVVLDFVLPQGPRGEKGRDGEPGVSAPVSSAPDVDVSRPPVVGEALVWNGVSWAPSSVLANVGPWAMGPQQFNSVEVPVLGSEGVNERLIGSMTVPGLPYDWRPIVMGCVYLRSDEGVRLGVDVHVGDVQMGDVVGRGVGVLAGQVEASAVSVGAFFEPGVSPSSSFGVVAANTPTDVSVVVRRVEGAVGGWEFLRDDASLVVLAQPVHMDY